MPNSRCSGPNPRHPGFSLLELLVVLALLSILFSIAVPYYGDYQKRTTRAAVIAHLSTCALAAERLAAIKLSYLEIDDDKDGVPDPRICSPETPPERPQYRIRVENLSAATFRFVATPVAETPMDGSGFLFLDESGLRGWDKNANGTIEADADPSEHNWQE